MTSVRVAEPVPTVAYGQTARRQRSRPAREFVERLRSVRIGVRLTCCFALMVLIMLLGAAFAIWQLNYYNRQVERLSSIDRRVISVLKVNNQVLAFRELMRTATVDKDPENVRRVLIPFRANFVQNVAEASEALRAAHASYGASSGDSDEGVQRTMYTLLSYETAIPREIDATLELARFQDWQALHYRLDKQMLQTSRVLSQVVGEIEAGAHAERKTTLERMTAIRHRVVGILPMCCFLVLLASGGTLGAVVTRSIARPLGRLADGAEALGAGNFSHRLDVHGNDELATVAVAFNQAAAQIERLHSRLESLVAERTADLRLANERLQKLSSQDGLTGIANRRTLDQRLQRELARAAEAKVSISLLMVDVDHFKGLNDAYGHQTGDECLIKVVRTMQSVPLRAEDLIARYGGEEFAVVLTDADAEGATTVAERMRAAVEELQVPNSGSPVLGKLSISVGVATVWPDSETDLATLFKAADAALYRAKRNGRNCVCAA